MSKGLFRRGLAAGVLLGMVSAGALQAGCYSSCCPIHRVEAADRTVMARVVALEVLHEGEVKTRATLRIEEELAGEGGAEEVVVTIPGGRREEGLHWDTGYVALEVGERYFLHLQRAEVGWELYQASAEKVDAGEWDDQKARFLGEGDEPPPLAKSAKSGDCGEVPPSRLTPSGYFEFEGQPGRLRLCDSGQPLVVAVDSEAFPAVVTRREAVALVREALDAWEAISGLRFVVTEPGDFGGAASTQEGGERIIHLQLHDLQSPIASDTTLGRAGGFLSNSAGGSVAGVEFGRLEDRWVVINHSSSLWTNAAQVAEVLTHEIGHALGLRHSSESASETETALTEAVMYYRVHNDGRGARTACYDADRIAFAYPAQLPPFAPTRHFRAASRPGDQPVSSVNRLTLAAFSSSGAPLSYSFPEGLAVSSGDWTFEAATGLLSFTPAAYYSDSVADPPGNFGNLRYVVSDGTHEAEGDILIVALRQDDNGLEDAIGRDNPLPEAWLEDQFGGAVVRANPTELRFQPGGDFDGDGLSNLQEFQLGTSAALASSGPLALAFSAGDNHLQLDAVVPGSLLQIERSADLATWLPVALGVGATGENGLTLPEVSGERGFFRVRYGP
ncbi:M57 family metalloprotease [Roseibacillus ishigakijimensis]|uniref:Matrixin family metalloprotease n=1 Tax=Roseibacillus ishigakijimensis TaxID=454146 RepID=A0A934RM76_9BACT|nr:M57 family metalloprotease [Roseibacillus ishigakijimensis]MBK1834352.1 matrixin family metalloprotease [Roseibacillus ishigakijimensis]